MSAMPPGSPSNHSLTKRRWKKTLLWILIFTACWACVMNGSNIYSCIWTPHIRWLWNMLSFLYHCHLPNFSLPNCVAITFSVSFVFLFAVFLFSVFNVTFISPTPVSPQSISAALFHFFVHSTPSLPEWQLTEVGSSLIYFTPLWIFSVNRAVFMHACQVSCVLIRGILNLICWLAE